MVKTGLKSPRAGVGPSEHVAATRICLAWRIPRAVGGDQPARGQAHRCAELTGGIRDVGVWRRHHRLKRPSVSWPARVQINRLCRPGQSPSANREQVPIQGDTVTEPKLTRWRDGLNGLRERPLPIRLTPEHESSPGLGKAGGCCIRGADDDLVTLHGYTYPEPRGVFRWGQLGHHGPSTIRRALEHERALDSVGSEGHPIPIRCHGIGSPSQKCPGGQSWNLNPRIKRSDRVGMSGSRYRRQGNQSRRPVSYSNADRAHSQIPQYESRMPRSTPSTAPSRLRSALVLGVTAPHCDSMIPRSAPLMLASG